jgi:hypothetical protein
LETDVAVHIEVRRRRPGLSDVDAELLAHMVTAHGMSLGEAACADPAALRQLHRYAAASHDHGRLDRHAW